MGSSFTDLWSDGHVQVLPMRPLHPAVVALPKTLDEAFPRKQCGGVPVLRDLYKGGVSSMLRSKTSISGSARKRDLDRSIWETWDRARRMTSTEIRGKKPLWSRIHALWKKL